ncbi:hypothetical protein GGI01_000935 [Coemansia sp. RSA 376]|nr:hypothetical protein GGI01_000935 [Coemansia sp. RSA 376]
MIRHSAADVRSLRLYANEPVSTHVVYAIVFWPVLAVYLVYVISTFALYLYFALHLRDQALLQRSPYLSTLQTVFGLMYCTNAMLQGALKRYPCFLQLWLLYLGYTGWSVTVMIAMSRYYVLARSCHAMGAKLRQIPVTPENLEGHLMRLLAACGTDTWQYEIEQRRPTKTAPRPPSTLHSSQRLLIRIDSDTDSPQDTPSPRSPRATRHAPAIASTPQLMTGNSSFAASIFPTSPLNGRSVSNERAQRQCADIISSRGHSFNNTPHLEPPVSRGRRSSATGTRTELWRRRLSSNRFITYIMISTTLVIVVFLLLVNILSPQMTLRPLYYNCKGSWEYIPLIVLAGTFNMVIYPAFVIMAWTYKDGYGIRRSLSIGSLTGILFWVGGLAWRLEKAIPKARAPPALFYMAQILLVYSFTIVTPLFVAWKNAGRRRTQGRDTHRVSRKGWSWSAGISEREYDLSKQSFIAAMQDPEEHDSIEKFAGRCFCIELVLFLDVYLALKMSIYKDIRRHGPNGGSAAPTDGNASISPLAHDMSPHHQAVDVPEPTPTHTADRLSLHSHFNSNPRTTRSLDIERHESAQLARGSGSQATLAASVSENLASLSSSISATMAHAFPEYSISDDTLISERLRCVLKTVVRTFMLPESPLAINVPHAVVCTFRDYLLGGPATFGMMEQVKEEVVNLLYSNVYIRYRQA